ncbi:hypothetical protein KZX46_07565 [Polymorphobacter sp. PAMC 29334]|uniref:hypothetical protein n=1 Tax=Polymorphobacter sp. PAMC 29334 TaxID=2862331 RepID=UPI001C76D2F5|nr:hypothetical protein [Polymorphobacter sp. PAMC 29334]QYE35803.1 hypothetical protein KZX46_07565 [Polymorphobacter sp. PAMC 29334]
MNRQSPALVVESFETTDWSSLTFAGQRHRITLVVTEPVSADSLSFDGLILRGSIVAEARVISATVAATGLVLDIAVMTIDVGA